MTKAQRYQYEMLVRARDFGAARRELFPESSTGAGMFARVTRAVAAIEEHLKNRVIGTAESRKVKAVTREAVYDYMKTVALAARRMTRLEPGANPFRMPRRRSLKVEISTARAFLAQAEPKQQQFQFFGLPATFISDFRTLVDQLQQAAEVRINSKTVKSLAAAGIRSALTEGLEAVRDLDAVVGITSRADEVTLSAWQTARRIEGQRAATPEVASTATPAEQSAASPAEPGIAAPEARSTGASEASLNKAS